MQLVTELGVTHIVYGPFNSLRSLRKTTTVSQNIDDAASVASIHDHFTFCFIFVSCFISKQ
jgi:hypothetical protein